MHSNILNLKPSNLLAKHVKKFSAGNALDIGCGRGRNAIFLAQHGFRVDAIDKDTEVIKGLEKYLKKNKIKCVKTKKINILNFRFKPDHYNLIVAAHSLDFLRLSEIKEIVKKIKNSLEKGGYAYLAVFSTKEPSYKKIISFKNKPVEKNTFFIPKLKSFRHFFTVGELKDFFQDWTVVFLKQKEKKDYHQDIGQHWHNIIEIIVKK